jgi:carboxymethylenebutenolidase
MKRLIYVAAALLVVPAVSAQQPQQPQPPPVTLEWNDKIPPGNADHAARALKESPRHGEWVDIKLPDGVALKTWVVYPERKDKGGVVLVIHDINGMRDWPRALGDQLAQDGFIALVPDFLSGKGPNGGGSESFPTGGVGKAIQSLTNEEMTARLNAAMEYGKKLPSSNGKTGVVGFCWGGARSFAYAAAQPALSDATPPVDTEIAKIKAPVIGFYGGTDMRINATVPWTVENMKRLGKSYETHTFEGAGHGFLGNQAGQGGANLKAAEQAWPLTVAFFQKHLK